MQQISLFELEIVLGVADTLGIKTDDIGKFFYQRKRR